MFCVAYDEFSSYLGVWQVVDLRGRFSPFTLELPPLLHLGGLGLGVIGVDSRGCSSFHPSLLSSFVPAFFILPPLFHHRVF